MKKKSYIQCLNKILITFEFKMVWIKYQNMAYWIAWNVWMIEPNSNNEWCLIKCEQTKKNSNCVSSLIQTPTKMMSKSTSKSNFNKNMKDMLNLMRFIKPNVFITIAMSAKTWKYQHPRQLLFR